METRAIELLKDFASKMDGYQFMPNDPRKEAEWCALVDRINAVLYVHAWGQKLQETP